MSNYKLRVRGLYAGAFRWSYGFNIQSTAAIATVASTLHDATNTFWTTTTDGYEHLVNADVTVVDVAAYLCNASWLTIQKDVLALSLTGSNANASLPFNTSAILSLTGDSDTKSDRGFMRLPTPANDSVTSHVFTSAFLAHVAAITDPFFVTMRGLAGYAAVSYNRRTNKQGEAPFTAHPLNKWDMSNKPGTERSRTKKILPTAFITGVV